MREQGVCCRLCGMWGTQGSAGFGSSLTCVLKTSKFSLSLPIPSNCWDVKQSGGAGSKQVTADRGCCLSSGESSCKLDECLKKGLTWR